MPVFSAQKLKKIGLDIFMAAGVPDQEAEIVSESLVKANLAGHDSHGVIRISQYVDLVIREMVSLPTNISVTKETPNTAAIDGNWGFGQVVAHKAMSIAIDKARRYSLGAVAVSRSNHIGRIGEYAEVAATEGMIGMVTVNNHGAGILVAPWGGRERRLSPNPLAVGIPVAGVEPVVLDISTSVSAEGKVRVKRNQGEKVPKGWIINHRGEPSTDPSDLYGSKEHPPGALLPMGGDVGYKGFGLSFVLDTLSGALSGAGCSGTSDSRIGNAIFILAISIEGFSTSDAFGSVLNNFIRYVKSASPSPGFDEVLIPGEPEQRTRSRRLSKGIPVDDVTWEQIQGAGRKVGLDLMGENP
jgi:uncharacterized oxidoreductase